MKTSRQIMVFALILAFTPMAGAVSEYGTVSDDSVADQFTISSGVIPSLGNAPAYADSGVLLGDANGDGLVSADDYGSVQVNFGSIVSSDGFGSTVPLLGDANGDGAVSADDYGSVQANFGSSLPESAHTPEPLTILAVFGGVVGVATYMRKRKKDIENR